MQRIITVMFALTFMSLLTGINLFSQATGTKSEAMQINAPGSLYLLSAEIVVQQGDKGILGKTQRIKIINLGPIVNSPGVDYAPTVSADGKTLFYVSDRLGSKENNGTPSHDFWAAKKNDRLDTVFFTPYNIDTLTGLNYLNVNTELNEGAASISADRQTLYFTACDRPDGFGKCDIYKSTIEGDKWGRPVNLGANVNTDNWESQPSISPDQKRIYFVSTRKGPNSNGKPVIENMDIWYCDWDDDLEDWKPAVNLEAINTKGWEYTPFIAADNSTLFFASNSHKPNYGGLDFYFTRYDPVSDSWSKPENLGQPINTKDDEAFITLPASGDIIYFSSTRKDLPGYQGNLDLFMAFVPSFFRAVTVLTTVIDECSQEFIPAVVTVKNPVTGRVVKDSITTFKPKFEVVISNPDYGNPKDSLKYVDLEITAAHPKYGSKTVTQRVTRPDMTEDPDEVNKPADEIDVVITLGQRPTLAPEIDEAEYIAQQKINKPSMGSWRGLVMKETKTWNLYPLLNYVFFDQCSDELPERYILFDSPEQTEIFTDTTILGGTLDKYYHLLNIYGYRLRNNPDAKIVINGTNDGLTQCEKNNTKLADSRAQKIYNYLRDIWQISESRMKLELHNKQGTPKVPTSTRVDSIGVEENRRVEIWCSDWEVVKPVFDIGSVTEPQPRNMTWAMKNGIEDALVVKRRIEIKRNNEMWRTISDIGTIDEKKEWNWQSTARVYPTDEVAFTAQLVITTQTGAECTSDEVDIPVLQVTQSRLRTEGTMDTTREIYNLILFPFDSDNAGPLNERIMRDYVYSRCRPTSKIEVIGHTDVVGMYDHNMKLSTRRANSVQNGINKETKSTYNQLNSKGVGEEDPLYTNDLPEGRFYNRTVQVIVRTPLSEYED
ncbi:MAG: PD40 domain-containing protein [Candidatus Kapabacteria bacterium]|nr:PD40 domain-containing protein [Ignavibacteriota bacterium]MCW5885853.1 PD40 domain-containing protein [Candidatus Kapabacteria bacterium]